MMRITRLVLVPGFLLGCLFCFSTILFAADTESSRVTLESTENGAKILIDGKLYAEYRSNYLGTPIIWPIIGPTGKKMTRDYPMLERDDNTEAKDHPHHRSFWFNHGDVNKSDFWVHAEPLKNERVNGSKIVQKKIETDGQNNLAIIITENDWLDKGGAVLCSDVRRYCFGVRKDYRYIDVDITVTAVAETVLFGDTKEGSFGIRIPGTMDMTAKRRNENWGGTIVNAEGLRDGKTWGKRSAWVDYSGPVEDETLGIAILNHPSSFRYPTYWHVRDYGLFAANPFGVHDFESITELKGEHTMKKGESFTLKYRVIFHAGDEKQAKIAEAFEEYSSP